MAKLDLLLGVLVLAVLVSSCQGWIPFFHIDYGKSDGFTESQWQNTAADVGDLDQWGVGVGFAYGGWLPGLMEPRFPSPIGAGLQPGHIDVHHVGDQPPANHSREIEAAGKWPWWTWLGLVLALGVVAVIVWQVRKIMAHRRGGDA